MKKILGISVIAALAVLPVAANAAVGDPVGTNGTPAAIAAADQPATLDAAVTAGVATSAAPYYALATQTDNDNNVASAGYVKGAYNASIKAINKVAADMSAGKADIDLGNVTAGSVVTNLIADGNVTEDKLATDSVTTAKIADSNVTTAKIADSNVTTAKIADSNVTTAKIADANVTTAKIADGNVTNAKLADEVKTSVENTVKNTAIAITPATSNIVVMTSWNNENEKSTTAVMTGASAAITASSVYYGGQAPAQQEEPAGGE